MYTNAETIAKSSPDNIKSIAIGRQPYLVRLRQGSVSPIALSAPTRQNRDNDAAATAKLHGTKPRMLATANKAKQTRNQGGRSTKLVSPDTRCIQEANSSAGASSATRTNLVIVAIS